MSGRERESGRSAPAFPFPKPMNHDFVISTEGRNLFAKTIEKIQKTERNGIFFEKS